MSPSSITSVKNVFCCFDILSDDDFVEEFLIVFSNGCNKANLSKLPRISSFTVIAVLHIFIPAGD
ncbi:MAG TPA: hypothetical protein DIT08_17765 [Enterococcus sp.]|nr:hypothetical protein [Enterococcus sp.]